MKQNRTTEHQGGTEMNKVGCEYCEALGKYTIDRYGVLKKKRGLLGTEDVFEPIEVKPGKREEEKRRTMIEYHIEQIHPESVRWTEIV